VCWIGTRPRTAGIPKAGAQEVGPKPAGRRSAGVRDTDSGKRAGRRPVDAGPLPEDEAAVQALGRLLRSNRTQKGLYHAVMGPWSLPRRIASRAFGPPPEGFYANEVIALARSGTGAVQRELRRLDVLRDKA